MISSGGAKTSAPSRKRAIRSSRVRPGLSIGRPAVASIAPPVRAGLPRSTAAAISAIASQPALLARASLSVRFSGASQHGLDPSNGVLGRERLRDVVVGAQRQALLALDVAAPGSEHDDANVLPCGIC